MYIMSKFENARGRVDAFDTQARKSSGDNKCCFLKTNKNVSCFEVEGLNESIPIPTANIGSSVIGYSAKSDKVSNRICSAHFRKVWNVRGSQSIEITALVSITYGVKFLWSLLRHYNRYVL